MTGTPHTARQCPLPVQGLPPGCCCDLVGGESCSSPRAWPRWCVQSSGCAATLVLLEIVGSPAGRQHLCQGEPLLLIPAPAGSSRVSQTSLPPFHIKKGKPKTCQNYLPPWLKVQIEVLLVCLKNRACSVLEYLCGVFVRETGSTKSHFSPQHRQKMTERDLGPSTVRGGRLLKEVLLL